MGFVGITVENFAKRMNADKVATAAADVASVSGRDQCRDKGASVARVYLENFRQAAEVGMMPSEMMTEACRRIAADMTDISDCRAFCEDGFRYVAKDAVRKVTR